MSEREKKMKEREIREVTVAILIEVFFTSPTLMYLHLLTKSYKSLTIEFTNSKVKQVSPVAIFYYAVISGISGCQNVK